MQTVKEARTANTGFASGGVTCKLGAFASFQVQCWLTVLCSESRPNAKPETVLQNGGTVLVLNFLLLRKTLQNRKFNALFSTTSQSSRTL